MYDELFSYVMHVEMDEDEADKHDHISIAKAIYEKLLFIFKVRINLLIQHISFVLNINIKMKFHILLIRIYSLLVIQCHVVNIIAKYFLLLQIISNFFKIIKYLQK